VRWLDLTGAQDYTRSPVLDADGALPQAEILRLGQGLRSAFHTRRRDQRKKGVAIAFSQGTGLSARVGTGALLAFASTAWVSTPLASVCLFVTLLAFLGDRSKPWRSMGSDPVVPLLAALLLYLAGRTVWGVLEFPASAREQLADALDWSKLCLFLLVAWWLGGDAQRILKLLGLALLGLFVGTAAALDLEKIRELLEGLRPQMQLPASSFGLFTVTGVLGLLLFAPRIWGSRERPGLFALRVTAWAVTLAVLVQAVITSQSRASWVAGALVIPLLLGLRVFSRRRNSETALWGRPRWPAAVVALVLLALLGANLGAIKHRLLEERSSIDAVLTGRWEEVGAADSVSYRAHLYQLGTVRWLERPLFGWGPGSATFLIEQSHIPALRHFKEFHNTYLDVLIRLGIVGSALLAAWLWLLLRSLWRAYRQGRLPRDVFLFLAGAFALLALWSLGDFRLVHADLRAYWLMLAGSAYTFQLHAARGSSEAQGRGDFSQAAPAEHGPAEFPRTSR
jgi:O-antigen ligase